ncbi:hypothetical protein ABH15_10025 [Methanoculleus taiwanensis]|uniref:Uncharacterized protein n=2 Tax=Methanoculleus taiwanensis TaxID=1550565 RepID=A0A498H0S0_9EURY|nr:hypothetical protein ABH15_10025 [Methanoculleus taiwanensis]
MPEAGRLLLRLAVRAATPYHLLRRYPLNQKKKRRRRRKRKLPAAVCSFWRSDWSWSVSRRVVFSFLPALLGTLQLRLMGSGGDG